MTGMAYTSSTWHMESHKMSFTRAWNGRHQQPYVCLSTSKWQSQPYVSLLVPRPRVSAPLQAGLCFWLFPCTCCLLPRRAETQQVLQESLLSLQVVFTWWGEGRTRLFLRVCTPPRAVQMTINSFYSPRGKFFHGSFQTAVSSPPSYSLELQLD